MNELCHLFFSETQADFGTYMYRLEDGQIVEVTEAVSISKTESQPQPIGLHNDYVYKGIGKAAYAGRHSKYPKIVY